MNRDPEQFEFDLAWEWIGEWQPEVTNEDDPKFIDALEEIMCINDAVDALGS